MIKMLAQMQKQFCDTLLCVPSTLLIVLTPTSALFARKVIIKNFKVAVISAAM